MPRKHVFHKRTKRSKSIRDFNNKKKCLDVSCSSLTVEGDVNIDPTSSFSEDTSSLATSSLCVQEESSEEDLNRQLDKSRTEEDTSSNPDEPSDVDYELPIKVDEKSYVIEEVKLNGRRIVDIHHFLSQFEQVAAHPLRCTMGRYELKREVVNGLFSTFVFFCHICEKEYCITSLPLDHKNEINDALVWGAMSVGIGHSQVEELFTILDVPTMGAKKFKAHEIKIGNNWEESLIQKMKANAEEEKRIAIEKNNFLNGVPFITVIGDGGWAKRSYGHGMNSLSGVGAIIGAETKKMLYLGVRNKFCFACVNPKRKNDDHLCFINYNGSSTGMESSIILEGFRKSEEDYGLVYKNYIGDGDSSVFARIQEGCHYGRFVTKIECANHVTRALSDHLHKLVANTQYPLESRQLLNKPAHGETITRLERLVKGVRTAIKEAGITRSVKDISNLRDDIRNAPDHVFGSHSRCREFCKRKQSSEENVVGLLNQDFLQKIRKLIGNVESKAESLVHNETTNVAERYMGCVVKFTGGKRVNFSTGGSFKRRCFGAGLAHTTGPKWHLSPWKKLQNRSPGSIFKSKILKREERRFKRKLIFTQTHAKRKRREGTYDSEYGPLAVKPDIEEDDLKSKCESVLEKLNEDVIQGNSRIEQETIGQHKNKLWVEKRINRLTASKFGAVAKRLPHTSCHNLVKLIIYPRSLNTEAVTFGRDNEDKVIELYEKKTSQCVSKCGLFVDPEHPFLGASPDGLVSNDGTIEIKCLHSVDKFDLIDEVLNKKKTICLELNKNQTSVRLKHTHSYYYQIQGQLNIADREWCDFVIYTKKGELFVERIERDKDFWVQRLRPKLVSFYKDCILPEIADSRIVRGLRVRDPPYILKAQEIRENKLSNKKSK